MIMLMTAIRKTANSASARFVLIIDLLAFIVVFDLCQKLLTFPVYQTGIKMSRVFDILQILATKLIGQKQLALQNVFGRQAHKGVAGGASAGEGQLPL